MNSTQGIILFLGLIAVALLCLRPPYQWQHTTHVIKRGDLEKVESRMESIGHYWIWAPPGGWTEEGRFAVFLSRSSRIAVMDWSRLGIYVGLTALVTLFGAFVVFNDKSKKESLK